MKLIPQALVSEERKLISRIFYFFILLIITVEYFSNHLIHQLSEPILIDPAADNVYWMLHLIMIPQFIASSKFISITFEMLWIVVTICCIVFDRVLILNWLFTFLFLVFIVTKNSLVAHQEHGIDAAFLMSFIFLVRNETRFSFLFKAFRYYVLFIFVSAACWKIERGSFANPYQLSEILKSQHAYYLSFDQHGIWYSIIVYLINHVAVSQTIFITAVFFQLIFLIGFFTRRFDKVLLIIFFCFFAADWFLMGLSFYQTFIAALVFINWKSLDSQSVSMKL